MKKLLLIAGIAVLAVGCDNARPVQSTNSATTSKPPTNEKPQTAIAHSSEKQTPPQAPTAEGAKSKWTQSGDPVDTTKVDAAVNAAKKTLDGKPTNAAAQKVLADAYYERAVALTDARQYASALGDYRRTLKLDPTNAEAKEWIDKIVMIYDGLKKEYPKEGEEPSPLPFTKGK